MLIHIHCKFIPTLCSSLTALETIIIVETSEIILCIENFIYLYIMTKLNKCANFYMFQLCQNSTLYMLNV